LTTPNVFPWSGIYAGLKGFAARNAPPKPSKNAGTIITQANRQRYVCRGCGKQFDDLTDTIFEGPHQALKVWIISLYFMGLNLSNAQIAHELDLAEGVVQEMTAQLRTGAVIKKACPAELFWLLPPSTQLASQKSTASMKKSMQALFIFVRFRANFTEFLYLGYIFGRSGIRKKPRINSQAYFLITSSALFSARRTGPGIAVVQTFQEQGHG
jgi:transposase-like protein